MIELEAEEHPHGPVSAAQRARKYRQTHGQPGTVKVRQKRAESREARLQANEAAYLRRRFVMVDGEGLNVRSGKRKGAHDYVLLAVSGREPILARLGIPTMRCFDYLWHNLSPADNNVIYGGSYDFNCWVRDFPIEVLRTLYDGRRVRYGHYTVKWLKGKSFTIRREGKSVTIYDVVSFFQCPFLQACDEYLGEYEGREIIAREKANRGNFTWRQISTIGKYNNLELDLGERLCNELRLRLNKVGLRPRRWIGPGAIAAALFEREGVRAHMSREIPSDVAEAARYAFAGGRFEDIKYGISRDSAFEYDLNSAYPKALSLVPSLAGGVWKHKGPGAKIEKFGTFALYRVRWEHTNPEMSTIPGPLFVRAPNGTICYPMSGENWVWQPEAENLPEYSEITGLKYRILESWQLIPATNHKPFGFAPALYERRKALKAASDGAHVGIKLGLNSMFGKTCQQIGWNKIRNEAPTYHQLEWAGYVTSYCRAAVLKAAMQDLGSVIAFETDALFTTHPLDIPVSDRLGEWERTEFAYLTYVQSGLYFGTAWNEKKRRWVPVAKSRGADRGLVTREKVETAMRAGENLKVSLTRFMGAGIALARGIGIWRRWLEEEKVLHLSPLGKRAPLSQDLVPGWNLTYCPVKGGMSSPFPIEWINPDPKMTELAELREAEVQYED